MDESITIKIEQLEELLENKEYAKEWKADRYFGLIKENMRLEQENENILKDFKRKLIRESKCIECKKYGHCAQECEETKRKCYTCGRIGHKQKDCHKDHICKKCNRKGHTERVCGNRKLKRKEE